MSQNKNRSKTFVRCVTSSLCAGFLALALVSGALAQWRWVDSSGTIHMSDKAPPPNIPEDKILSRPDPNRPSIQQRGTRIVGGDDGSKPADMSSEDRRLEEERAKLAAEQAKAEEERKREEEARRVRSCENAKKRLELYTSGHRIRDIDSKGEFYYLTDQQIAEQRKEAEADRKMYCTQ